MVQDGVDLRGEQIVQPGDVTVEPGQQAVLAFAKEVPGRATRPKRDADARLKAPPESDPTARAARRRATVPQERGRAGWRRDGDAELGRNDLQARQSDGMRSMAVSGLSRHTFRVELRDVSAIRPYLFNCGNSRHHPQRRGQLLQLQPGTQPRDGVVRAGLAGDFLDLDLRLAERVLAPSIPGSAWDRR